MNVTKVRPQSFEAESIATYFPSHVLALADPGMYLGSRVDMTWTLTSRRSSLIQTVHTVLRD